MDHLLARCPVGEQTHQPAIGQGLMFEVAGAPGEVVEIDDAVEGRYEAGAWVSGRNLNGDERLNLLPLDRFAAVRIRVLRRRA